MTFRFLIDEVREVVSIGLEKMGHVEQEFDVLESPRKEFGDLTCNVAFKISKKLKAAPYAIAEGFTEKYLKMVYLPLFCQSSRILQGISIFSRIF